MAGQGYYRVHVQNADGTWKTSVSGAKFASSKTHVVGKNEFAIRIFARYLLVVLI